MRTLKFKETIEIDSSASRIFDFSQDYNNRLAWDPFLKQADLIDGAKKAAKGVKALCVAKNGWGMVTEYITFNRPKVTAVKMTKGPYMFESFFGSWRFKEIGKLKTRVTFIYAFKLRFPFNLLGYIIKQYSQSNVRQRLLGLKVCVEEGDHAFQNVQNP